MRTQDCREAMEKVAETCGISKRTINVTDPITNLCKEKGNAPLRSCATAALEPLTKIKDRIIQRKVISEINRILTQRNDKTGDFIKKRLTLSEIEAIITKYQPIKKSVKQVRYRLTKQHQTIIKRTISLNYAPDERAAFNLVFKWAAEHIAKKK